MSELHTGGFAEFFEALWNRPPFAWQRSLAERVTAGGSSPWPEAIAVPTGAGKTACLDVAIYALAASLRAHKGVVTAAAARRIFFVVDRRVIVDEAYRRAAEIARRLENAREGILATVSDALRQIAYGRSEDWQREKPLLAFELRGGMYRSEAWARTPLQPLVVASTVDQIGSRLMFRAYGRSPGMWPVYAGLVANDSLVFLDEAHCARPFMETLQAVDRYRQLAKAPIQGPFSPVILSATPPGGLEDVFRDESSEPSNPEHPLGRRILASKPASLVAPVPVTAKTSHERFAQALVEHALEFSRAGSQAIVIFCNRVATARHAHRLLSKDNHDPVLLTGRMRSLDRDDTVMEQLSALSADRAASRSLSKPIFVVATQTLEVGANLDFDALVTECASLDALRQRFGRLNRTGRAIDARAAIVIRSSQTDAAKPDPVYGAALAKTWQWLQANADGRGQIDFGVAALAVKLPTHPESEALNAPRQFAAVLLPAHLDVLAQTNPVPMPSPDVSFFLRGPTRSAPDVLVCWRGDISAHGSEEDILEALLECPPATSECAAVPISRLRDWMLRKATDDETSDIEGDAQPEEEAEASGDKRTEPRRVILWRGRDRIERTSMPRDVRPGDVVILPADAADCDDLADLSRRGADGPVADWGDRAHLAQRAQAVLRLHPALVQHWPIGEELRIDIHGLVAAASERIEVDEDGFEADLRALLSRVADHVFPPPWRWLGIASRYFARKKHLSRRWKLHPFRGLVLKGNGLIRDLATDTADVFSDEHDSTASGTVRVPLGVHLTGVASFARRFADGAGLDSVFAAALELSGKVHDLGKADPRFQRLLRAGAPGGSELLAKSATVARSAREFERIRSLAGYPIGGRHELLSLALVEQATGVLPDDPVARELVLHLVASHHGYCRPFAPVVEDSSPIAVSFTSVGHAWRGQTDAGAHRLDSGVSDRFWSLTRHFGWWGLAWFEAIMRLADHRRSEWEQANPVEGEDDE